MTIPFHCPHCGHFTEVEPQFAGHSGPCVRCGQTITIPQATATPDTAARAHRRLWGYALVATALLVSLVLLGLIIWQGMGQSAAVVVPTATMTCEENLTKIGRALLAYHEQHGHFPAAGKGRGTNNSGLSCGAEILPQLNEDTLSKQVRFQNDWDGQANAAAAAGRPPVYAAADDELLNNVETSYVAITGDEFAFAGDQPRSKQEFTDGLESTVLVIETRGLGISWLEPRDLNGDRFDWLVNQRVTGAGSRHAEGGIHVLMANGDVHWLDDSIPPEVLRALATINGGEQVNLSRWLKQ